MTEQRWKTFLPTEMMDAVRGFASLYVLLCHVRFMLLISIASAGALGLQG
ncbi:MAG: hypothetical protein M3442_08120 [Chloroflexota bacterium]|nr:hypothetical protein [Chloroflexota bacterium]